MYEQVTFYRFRDQFSIIRPENFSYKGLTALYDYLIEWEEDSGEQIELDVIALCCDFQEFQDIKEIFDYYGIDEDSMTDEQLEEYVCDHAPIVSWEKGCYLFGQF